MEGPVEFLQPLETMWATVISPDGKKKKKPLEKGMYCKNAQMLFINSFFLSIFCSKTHY